MGLFSRLFGPKLRVEDRRFMNEDWRVGDLAKCIADTWATSFPDNPCRGEIRRVSGIREGHEDTLGDLLLCLQFEGHGSRGWETRMFRKIRPLHEPCEAKFTALIKRPVRRRERV